MKKGKPEVLIIGEVHPSALYADIFPKGTTELTVDQLSNLKLLPARIINHEIRAIKKFHARRVLFELPNTRSAKKIYDHLESGNFEEFQKAFLDWYDLLRKRELSIMQRIYSEYGLDINALKPYIRLIHAQIIIFIQSKTEVNNILFFDDYETSILYAIYDTLSKQLLHFVFPNLTRAQHVEKWNDVWAKLVQIEDRRNNLIVKNIRKRIIDKTVIICGYRHVEQIERGISSMAYLHPSIHLRVPLKDSPDRLKIVLTSK